MTSNIKGFMNGNAYSWSAMKQNEVKVIIATMPIIVFLFPIIFYSSTDLHLIMSHLVGAAIAYSLIYFFHIKAIFETIKNIQIENNNIHIETFGIQLFGGKTFGNHKRNLNLNELIINYVNDTKVDLRSNKPGLLFISKTTRLYLVKSFHDDFDMIALKLKSR
jgi:hypothetical protein